MDRETPIVYGIEHSLDAILKGTEDSTVVTVNAFGSRLSIPASRRFGDIESIQRYLDMVLGLDEIAPLNKRGAIKVRKRKGKTRAHYEPGTIAIPDAKWAMTESTVLHEVAHHLSWDGHGPRFRGVLCHLVEVVMSPEAAFYLRASFSEAGLRIESPIRSTQ